MREKLGVLLIEDESGFSVQLFEDPAKTEEVFRQLKYDKSMRATLVSIEWKDGKTTSNSVSLTFPKTEEERPEGWLLGRGPIKSLSELGKEGVIGDSIGEVKGDDTNDSNSNIRVDSSEGKRG